MKNKIFTSIYILGIAAGTLLGFFSCTSNVNKNAGTASADRTMLLAKIDSLQKIMFNQKGMELDKSVAAQGIAAYLDFVKQFPNDSLAAEYLYRSSDLSRAMGDNKNAIQYLNQICTNYPTFRKIPDCLFLQGYYYQEYFKDTAHAKIFYKELILKYPSHSFVKDAKALMKMFGKTDEEIIKDFEQGSLEKKKI